MRHRRSAHVTILALLVLITVIGVGIAPLSSGTPPAADTDSISGYVVPRMVALNETIVTVRDLIEERSRNLLALRANADRIERLTTEIDAWISGSGRAHLVAEAVRQYELGRDIVREAMDGARTALATFDFSSLAALVERFDSGADSLEVALELFQNGA